MLTQIFNYIWYGKQITEDYIGKVVKVYWREEGCDCWQNATALITVLWDDGKYNIAGPVFIQSRFVAAPIDSKTGLFNAHKRDVTVVADSVAEYKEAKRIKETRKRCQQSVCCNEAGEVGIVTDYDGTTFTGRTLEGKLWESKEAKCLAVSYADYVERH